MTTVPIILNPYRIDEHSEPLKWNPQPKHHEIIREIFRPRPDHLNLIDIVCGIAFGKTTLAVIIAAALLEKYPGYRLKFYEPDAGRLKTVFWAEWKKWIPERLYKIVGEYHDIHWHNGSILYPRHRWVTGSPAHVADMNRGDNLHMIIDDEAAIGYNDEFYKNGCGRLRLSGEVVGYITLSTPKVGPYGNLLDMADHKIFHGRTADNAANLRPGFEAMLRSQMSEMHARRELDGEMVALEGRVWECFDRQRNICEDVWDRNRPYMLGGDIGVQSSWLILQNSPRGYLACVGEYHPDYGGTSQDVDFVFGKWGRPVKIIAGRDMNTDSVAAGDSSIIEIKKQLSKRGMSTSVPIVTPTDIDAAYRDKSIQYSACTDVIELGKFRLGHRCVPDKNNLMPAVFGNQNRSLYKMFQQDAFPKPGAVGWFVKDKKKGSGIEDVRDALLYTLTVQFPPRIGAKAA